VTLAEPSSVVSKIASSLFQHSRVGYFVSKSFICDFVLLFFQCCTEIHAETFSIEYYSSTGRSDGPLDMLFQEYSRPVYTYIGGDEDEDKDIELAEYDILILMYSGSRWFGMWFSSTEWGALMEDFKTFIAEFHGEFYR